MGAGGESLRVGTGWMQEGAVRNDESAHGFWMRLLSGYWVGGAVSAQVDPPRDAFAVAGFERVERSWTGLRQAAMHANRPESLGPSSFFRFPSI
jgi:hypothetical protein